MGDASIVNLDSIADSIAEAADRGQPIVLTLDHEPEPHVRRLMATLGVPVEVVPVTVVGAQQLLETRDCVKPGCPEPAFKTSPYCRRHAPIADLAPTNGHDDDGGLAAIEAMDAGDRQSVNENGIKTRPEIAPPGPTPALPLSPPTNEAPKPEEEVRMVVQPAPGAWSRKPVSRDDAIAALQQTARELGHVPTQWEWRKAKRRPSDVVYERHFSDWASACRAAGLEPPPPVSRKPAKTATATTKVSGRERREPPAPEKGPSPAPSPAVSPAVRQEPLEPATSELESRPEKTVEAPPDGEASFAAVAAELEQAQQAADEATSRVTAALTAFRGHSTYLRFQDES